MQDKIENVLKKTFGFDSFKKDQYEPIEELCKDRPSDILCIYPTSAGKSLIYQLPSIYKRQCSIVISPLISLMSDQITKIRYLKLKAFSFSSDDSMNSHQDLYQAASQPNAQIDFIFTTPESFQNDYFKSIIMKIKMSIGMIAVDECHVITEWGKSFRPAYRNLKIIRDTLPGVPIVALTASTTYHSAIQICQSLNLINPKIFVQSFNRPNIQYSVWHKNGQMSKNDILLQTVEKFKQEYPKRSIIIYTATRQEAENLEQFLSQHLDAQFYHAGLSADQKNILLSQWQSNEIKLIIATIAFAMGIDKASVGLVIHYCLPKSMEGFYQESGRAGRDGVQSHSLVLVDNVDVNFRTTNVTKDDEYDQFSYYNLLLMLLAQQCRRKQIHKYFKSGFPFVQQENCCDFCSNSIFKPLFGLQQLQNEGIIKGVEAQITQLKARIQRGSLNMLFKEQQEEEEDEKPQKPNDLGKKIIDLHKKLCIESKKRMGAFQIDDLENQMMKVTDYIKIKAQNENDIEECGKKVLAFINRSKKTFSTKMLEMEVFRFFVGK